MGIGRNGHGHDLRVAMTPRDGLRSVVYAAEAQWSAAMDRGGKVDFFGSSMTLPCQRRFADLPSMQAYCDGVMSLSAVASRYSQAGPVRVRVRAGAAKAHYEHDQRVIAIPLAPQAGASVSWAGRESVLLHELSHHLVMGDAVSLGDAHHGTSFTTTMCWLVDEVLGPQSALLLRSGYQAAGVQVGSYVG